jgi:hypothetical protein
VKKLVAVALAGLLLVLVPMLVAPAEVWADGWHGGHGGWHGGGWHGGHSHGCCWGWGGFAVGVGVGALATAPYWYPPAYYGYPYPAYPAYSYPAYPAYSYPAYSYPTTPPPAYPPQGPPAGDSGYMPQTGQSATVTPATMPPAAPGNQNCGTVTIDGHNEIRTLPNGQSVTTWIPTHTQQVCQ